MPPPQPLRLAQIVPWATGLVGLLGACVIEPAGEAPGYACTVDAECAPGYSCKAGACASDGDADDAGESRPDAGPVDAGARDGGPADVDPADGGPLDDAGPFDAGLLDAGPLDAGPPLALSVQPAVAAAGRTLWLEGRFGDGLTVRFPGGAEVAAVRAGRARAAVEVPATAARGALSVLASGIERKGPRFSRPGYAVALSSLRRDDEQASLARALPRLGTPRHELLAVAAGGRLYAIGGEAAEGPVALVESAPVFADGSLGAFVAEPAALAVARAGAAAAQAGDFLFVTGGRGALGALASVERAPVLESGLGSFAELEETALAAPRDRAAAVVIGGWLYVLGGRGEGGALASVERAPVFDDGSLGPFSAAPSSLARPREGHQALVVGERLYVLGGEVDGAASASVEVADITGAGGIGAFSEVSGALSLVEPRDGAVALALDDDVYVLGAGSVERAVVEETGLAPFSLRPAWGPGSLWGHAAAVSGDFLYVLGGNEQGAPSAAVERASLRAGTLGPQVFVESGASLPEGQTYPSAVVLGPWLYVIGGNSRAGGRTAAVHRARIQPDGTLGAFAPADPLPEPRAYTCTAVLGDWLYLVGGNAADNVPIASVLRAPIDEDGELGAFEDASVSLVTPRHAATCTVIGERLWVFGGSSLDTIESAPLLEGGALGAFALEARTLVEPRAFSSTALIGGKLVIAGGYVGDQVLDTFEVAPVEADGSVGAFQLASLPSPLCCSGTAVLGTRVYFLGGQTSAAGDQLEGAHVADFAAPSPAFENTPLDLAHPRRGHRAVVIADRVHLLGGWDNGDDQLAVESALLP